ncbi:uncharacterized protein [Nicotiana sylvestris]|uniref:uncharacterized protein n=1 Tax=Nicotiana sylvestris TaxID=4096 RepID=UPI00388C5DE1
MTLLPLLLMILLSSILSALASFSTLVSVTPSLPISAVSIPPQTVFTTSIVPPSTIPPPIIPRAEVGSTSRSSAMRQVIIEVPAEGNLLMKSGQEDVWLKPLNGPIEKAKLESHSSLTLMNDIVHAYLKVRALTTELAVEKAASSQADKEKARLETSFSEQLSKASKEIRELKALLGEKEAYAGELVQNLTQAQEDLRASSDKVCALESYHTSLQASYTSALAENEKLKNEIDDWERDYEILEDKSAIEVSWAFLNSCHDTLVEASQETFNLESELAKINETIEKAQQTQDFPSPVAEASENVEVDTGIPTPSSPVEPAIVNQVEPTAVDAPTSVPTSS